MYTILIKLISLLKSIHQIRYFLLSLPSLSLKYSETWLKRTPWDWQYQFVITGVRYNQEMNYRFLYQQLCYLIQFHVINTLF
jgi:hypothetical protein